MPPMTPLRAYALSITPRPAPVAEERPRVRITPTRSRRRPNAPGYIPPSCRGTCSECGKAVRVGRTSAPPERRRCQECRKANPRKRSDWSKERVGEPRACELCGEPYVPKRHGRPDQRWCSKSCAQAWRNGGRPPYEKRIVVGMPRKLQLRRMRSQRRTETWDGVTDAEIFERDHWKCGICGKRIGKSFKAPHPRSKSIDHIVPLSEGGDDTAANKRAAHLLCNTTRCNRGGGEQLALIG